MTRFLSISFLLLVISFTAFGEAKAKDAPSRSELLARIEAACTERVEEDFKNPGEICSCISRNLDAKLGSVDLRLITLSHEEDMDAEKELQKPKHSALINFDYEVTETCLENPAWNH